MLKELSAPCQDCERREIGCHGKCEDYKKFSDYAKKVNHKVRSEKEIDNLLFEHQQYFRKKVYRAKKHER